MKSFGGKVIRDCEFIAEKKIIIRFFCGFKSCFRSRLKFHSFITPHFEYDPVNEEDDNMNFWVFIVSFLLSSQLEGRHATRIQYWFSFKGKPEPKQIHS